MKTGKPRGYVSMDRSSNGGETAPAKADFVNKVEAGAEFSGAENASMLASDATKAAGDDSLNAMRMSLLRATIVSGSFNVNTGAVADKLIAKNLAALARRKS